MGMPPRGLKYPPMRHWRRRFHDLLGDGQNHVFVEGAMVAKLAR